MQVHDPPAASPVGLDGPKARGAPAEYALLGLILLAGGQAHGYALTRQRAYAVLVTMMPGLEPALVYYYLKKLARRGWIAVLHAGPHRHRVPRPYAITAEGIDIFWEWIGEPCAGADARWADFLAKLFLVDQIEPPRAASLVRNQYVACRSSCDELERNLRGEPAAMDALATISDSFDHRVAQLRLLQLRAFMHWLDATRFGRESALDRGTWS